MSNRSIVLTNAVFGSIGRYLEYFSGLIIAVVIARKLGPEQYGMYSYLLWIAAMAVIFSNAGLASGCTKFVAELRGAAKVDLIPSVVNTLHGRQYINLAVVVAIVLTVYAAIGPRLFADATWGVILLVMAAAALKANHIFFEGVAVGLENFRATALVTLIAAPINLVLVVIVAVLGGGVTEFVLVYLLASGVRYFFLRTLCPSFAKAQTSLKFAPELRQRIGRHVRIVSVITILGFLVSRQLELFFLNLFNLKSELGYFNAAYLLATSATALVPGVFAAVLLPMMARSLGEATGSAKYRFEQSVRYLVILSVPVAVFCSVYSSEIVVGLFGAKYELAVIPFVVLVLSSSIAIVSQAASSYQLSADNQHKVLYFIVGALFLNIVLDWFLIKGFGLTGAVAGYGISVISLAIGLMVLTVRDLHAKLDYLLYARCLTAGVISVLLTIPSKMLRWDIATVILAGGIFTLVYLVCTWSFNLWSLDDKSYAVSLLSDSKWKDIVRSG